MDAAIPIMSPDAAQSLGRGTSPAKGEGEFAEFFAGECRKQGEQDIPADILWQVCQMSWMQSPVMEPVAGAEEQVLAVAGTNDGAEVPAVLPQGQALDIPVDAQMTPAQAADPLLEAAAEAPEGTPAVAAGAPAEVISAGKRNAAEGPVSQANAADGTSDVQTIAAEKASNPEQATGTVQGQSMTEMPYAPAEEPSQTAAGQTAYAQEAAAQPQAVSVTTQTAEAKTITDMAQSANAGKQPRETAPMPQTQVPAEARTDAGQNAGPAVVSTALKQTDATIDPAMSIAPETPDTPQVTELKERAEVKPVEAQPADAFLAVDGRQAPMEQAAAVQKTQTAPTEAVSNAQHIWEAIESSGLKDGERLTVKLKPEMLGGLTIEAVKTGRGTEVHIVAETMQGLRAMEQEIPALTQHMQGMADFAGMQLSCRQDGGFAQEQTPFIRGAVPLMQMQEAPDMAGSTINHSGVLNILA
jgi:flagellar hook-length control protein FliK